MKPNYKLIATDIDDTLLTHDRKLTTATKNALINAQKNGVILALCSGRPVQGMVSLAKELELDKFGGYIIAYNGANIYDVTTEKIIFEKNLSVEQIHKLYDLSQKHGVGIHTYSATHVLAEKEYKYTKVECNITGMPLEIISEFKKTVNNPVVKAIMVDEPEILRSIEKSVINETDGMYNTFSKPYFFEFMNNGVDKGLSLKYLCEKLNIKSQEVISFGDSHNDLPILEYAGKAVAMENAVDEAKKIADFMTKSNDEDGICHALELFLY